MATEAGAPLESTTDPRRSPVDEGLQLLRFRRSRLPGLALRQRAILVRPDQLRTLHQPSQLCRRRLLGSGGALSFGCPHAAASHRSVRKWQCAPPPAHRISGPIRGDGLHVLSRWHVRIRIQLLQDLLRQIRKSASRRWGVRIAARVPSTQAAAVHLVATLLGQRHVSVRVGTRLAPFAPANARVGAVRFLVPSVQIFFPTLPDVLEPRDDRGYLLGVAEDRVLFRVCHSALCQEGGRQLPWRRACAHSTPAGRFPPSPHRRARLSWWNEAGRCHRRRRPSTACPRRQPSRRSRVRPRWSRHLSPGHSGGQHKFITLSCGAALRSHADCR